MSVWLDKIIAGGLLLAIVLTTLTHGAVNPWSLAIFELLILLLLFLWAIKCAIDRKIEIRIPATALPLAAILAYAFIQSIVTTDETGRASSWSFEPEATHSAAVTLFFLLAAHIIAANFYATRERLKTLVKFLIVFGLLFAVFALVQYFTWNDNLYWLRLTRTGGMVAGSFINHNHFAGYMELLIPLPIALVFANVLKQTRVLFAFSAVMMTVAAIAALSRGGMISLAASGLFIVAASIYQTSRYGIINRRLTSENERLANPNRLSRLFNLAGIVVILGAIVLGTFLVGSEPVVDRLTNNSVVAVNGQGQNFENARGWIWRNSWAVFRENPVYGVGLGAFQTAFPRYSENDGFLTYGFPVLLDRAHNDYLQILTDTGIVGGVIAVWFIFLLLAGISRALNLRDSLCQGLAVGSGAAIVAMLIHSFFDFNLQLPGTALLFLVITAVSTNLPVVEAEMRKNWWLKRMMPETKLLSAPRI